MNARERFNQLLSYADGAVALAVVEQRASVSGDQLVDAKAEAVRTTVNTLGDQARVQALESVDRWSTADVSALMATYAKRADELSAQTRNALHRVAPSEIVQPLQHAVRQELMWLFKNVQLVALPDRPWTLLADDSCQTCAALARAGVADADVLREAWVDDCCGSALLVDNGDETDDVTGWLRVTGVPRKYVRAVSMYVNVLWNTWAPLLVQRGELGFVHRFTEVHGLTKDLLTTVAAHKHVDTGVWYARWSPSTWRRAVANAAVDDDKLPLDMMRKGYEAMLTGDDQPLVITSHRAFNPNKVVDPLACGELVDYAHTCAVELLVDPVHLQVVDHGAYTALCELVNSKDRLGGGYRG